VVFQGYLAKSTLCVLRFAYKRKTFVMKHNKNILGHLNLEVILFE